MVFFAQLSEDESPMGIVRPGPPEPLVLALRDALGADTFIETGTFRGATAEWASREFATVHSIELAEAIYQETRDRIGGIANLKLYLGNTRTLLPELIAGLQSPAVLWLDAHWSGGATSGESDQCPLLDELAIADTARQPLAVLVDDARFFVSPPPAPLNLDHWPDLVTVIERLSNGGQNYVAVTEDILVAAPMAHRPVVVEHCRRIATEALPKKGPLRRGIRSAGRKLRRLAGR
jgi:hypothetical protein